MYLQRMPSQDMEIVLRHRHHRYVDGLYILVLCFVLLSLLAQKADASGPAVTLAKSASPATTVAGGRVTYTITLTNSGNESAENITVRDALPVGFAYRSGTSQVTLNGATVSIADPTVSGNALTWSGLRLPSGRSEGYYGMHTFVQSRWAACDRGYLDYQLDRVRELMGPGSYVTQLFDWIETSWQGPPDCWRDFILKAYDRQLMPVVRLAGPRGQYWIKPKRDPDGSYYTWAQAFKRVVQGLPKRDGYYLYIQIWNEPNLNQEWEGQANPSEYGQFLVETAAAIRTLNDPHIKILNAPLSPGGEYPYLTYLEDMLNQVSAAVSAFDVWASHPYPGNRPPSYNIRDGTARDNYASIDLYQRELEILARHGRSGVKVLLTETGYALYDAYDVIYQPINETNRADYMVRAFRDYWRQWPEVIGVCPYELVDPEGIWGPWDWLWRDGRTHQQYDAVKALGKLYSPVSSMLRITFSVTAPITPGVYSNNVTASSSNITIPPATNVAPVTVLLPTPTRTATPTTTQTSTPTSTVTPTPEPTLALTFTETPTPSPSATLPAELASATPTALSTPTLEGTATPAETQTPSPTATPGPSPALTRALTPTSGPTATQTPLASPTVSPTAGCIDLIINGGFETQEVWYTPQTAHPAGYSTTRAHSGLRSMRLGIESGDNVYSFSTARQDLHVPTDAANVTLSFWYYPLSGDTTRDLQYALIQDDHGNTLDWVLNVRSDAQYWIVKEYSLNAYKGRDIRICFGVYNDGGGGVTVMYVDDVSVLVCAGQPTSSPTSGTPPAQAFLPIILRPFGAEGAQIDAVSLGLVAAPALLSNVRTLWQPAQRDVPPDFIQGIALNPSNDLLYVAAGKAVLALHAATGDVVARIALHSAPRGLAVDVATNRLYAALWEDNALAVIDGARHAVVQMVQGIPGAGGVAVSKERVYVAATHSNELVIADKENGAIIKRVPVGEAPYAVACDYAGQERVFVANASDDAVSILDGRTGAVLSTVSLGGLGHPHGLAFDAVRDRLYVTYTFTPRYGAIVCVDVSSGRILSRLVGNHVRSLFGAYGVTVDPLRGWVYVIALNEALTLAGETLRVLHEMPGIGPAYAFGVCLDPIAERLYVADARHANLIVCSRSSQE